MTVVQDVRVGVRSLRRGGWLPVVVVLMLAVAIGGATAIFSMAEAVLLRPLPLADPERLVVLWARDDARSQGLVEVSVSDARAWRASGAGLGGLALFGSVNWGELSVLAPGEPFRAAQNAVSAEFFDVLGAPPILGRTFTGDDDRPNAAGTVVLSERVWRRHLSSDPGIIGRILTVPDGKTTAAVEVIGIMPADFQVPAGADVWVPLGPALARAAAEQKWDASSVRAMYAVGRLADQSSAGEIVAALSTVARQEERKAGHGDSSMTVVATPFADYRLGPARPALLAIAGASVMLLLIAIANAASLLLVHDAARRREVAVRIALGASRWQILRQMLCESLTLSLIAGGLGVALAYAAFEAIVSLAPIDVPRLDQAAIDGRALLFAVTVCLVMAAIVGVLPARQHRRDEVMSSLQQRSATGTAGGAASSSMRNLLVAAQIAAAVVLLTGAALFTRSFVSLLRLDLGFDPAPVLTFTVSAPDGKYDTKDKQWALVDDVLRAARQLPQTTAAGAVYLRPFAHGSIGMDSSVLLEGQPITAEGFNRNPTVNWEVATPDYFLAMDIRLVQGRTFTDGDNEHAPSVIVISASLARRLWPGQDAIGRRLLTWGARGDEKNPEWQTVIGVVEDARYREVQAPRFDLYLAYRQAPNPVQHYMLRVSGDPHGAAPALRSAVAAIDRDLRLDQVETMSDVVGRTFSPWRFSAIVVSGFSITSLAFAAVGVAALVAYAVSRRTREIGVRVALGAQRHHLFALILREGLAMPSAGLAAGLLVAWLLRRTVSSLLFDVAPEDPASFVGAAVLLVVISLVAAYLPARRVARIDPVVALRAE